MKKIIHLLAFLSMISFTACEDVVFLPIEGTIEGTVTDNNGAALEGVQITGTFEAPSDGGQPFESNKTTTTLGDGFYRLNGLWDEVKLDVNHPGFQPASTLIKLTNKNNRPTVDFILVGSPTITAVNLNKEVLSAGSPDTLIANIEIQDKFNSITQGYVSNLLLLRPDGTAATILNAQLESQGLEAYLFRAVATSEILPAGAYKVAAEVRDPDGNEHRLETGEITIE